MAQTPKKKKPSKLLELSDHDLMEKLFGKRVMKEVDSLVAERSEDPTSKRKRSAVSMKRR